MAQKLVIVESPAKARTLSKILGKSYVVTASMGHVRDLPKATLGIDTDADFTPKYVIPTQKKKVVREIKEAVKKADSVYLATDPDREGEAISWHLLWATGLNANSKPVERVVFHEITKEAVLEAFRNPRTIDMDLVYAQQARRILDRLVGYKLSPLLWRKVQKGLSAGRVQSAAVRKVVDREREIQEFISEEYWIIEVLLSPSRQKRVSFKAKLVELPGGKKAIVASEGESTKIVSDLRNALYTVKSIEPKRVTRQPSPPFITSTLQQEAWRKLHFTAKQTMVIAQQLYEGLPLGKEGSAGLITYMRTDSMHIAASAIAEARDYIGTRYGKEFVPQKPRGFSRKTKWAQEAHEAIRPTRICREPNTIKEFLSTEQRKLYELIWKRMVASQMSTALYDTVTADIEATTDTEGKSYLLRALSSSLKFPGFLTLYSEGRDDKDQEENLSSLPDMKHGDNLKYLDIFPEQSFTQPPPRYNEATLIKTLEKKGIGRPSTYASILSTIQERDYVRKEKGKFIPEELGVIVDGLLRTNFPKIVDLAFTAHLEKELDEIAHGEQDWISMIKDFYRPFEDTLLKASQNIQKIDMTKPSGETCPDCGRPMVIKVGRFGKFIACSGYPECKTTKPLLDKIGIACPQCGGDLVKKMSKKKKVFYACSRFPECRFVAGTRPLPYSCPQCGKLLVQDRKDWARCISCGHKVKQSELDHGKNYTDAEE